MRKRIVVVLVLLALSVPSFAGHRHFLMWKVQSPTATVYLVGSIHLADPSVYPLPSEVEKAFAGSQALAVEADVNNFNLEDGVSMLSQYGMYTDGDSLSKHLSAQTARELDAFCEKNGLPRELLETMKPWTVALMAEASAAQASGFDAASGIDMHFLNEAHDKRVDQFESVEFQFKLLGSASDDEQQEFLSAALKESGDIGKTEDAYERGDVAALSSEISRQEPRSYYQRLLDDRNPAMTDKVAAYLNGHEQVFVVVGIGHVIGDTGIAHSLERKGFKVEAQTFDW
jgi:uncharacterized protein YbaP (TraB family)